MKFEFSKLLIMSMMCAWIMPTQAFTFVTGYKSTVEDHQLTFLVNIPGISNSGVSWNDAFDESVRKWSMMTPVELDSIRTPYDTNPCRDNWDGVSEVGFSHNLCGQISSPTSQVAGIAMSQLTSSSELGASDISFHTNLTWDVYDGITRLDTAVLPRVQVITDFKRVALHEIGHSLGLGHSSFPRSMLTNSPKQVFDKDTLTADDICGVNIAHGNPMGCPILLPVAVTVTGNPTSAVFVGGASSDRGATYADWFAAKAVIDVMATVVVEDDHFGQEGRLHAVIQLTDGTTLMWGSHGFAPWDGSVEGLRSGAAPLTLSGANEIYLLEDFDLAANGIANVGVAIFVGYSVDSDPSEIYYSGTPIQFWVE